ncbi:MAG: energy transducer TonB [Prevotellaceae bacterium]|jgi:TonB family protein|nr:energy transducer TonB [Prevotellaceae bacterium]
MKKYILIILVLLCCANSFAQITLEILKPQIIELDDTTTQELDKFFAKEKAYADSLAKENSRFIGCWPMPMFVGGETALYEFLNKNIQNPQVDTLIEGKVVCRFAVEEDGSISEVEIIKSLHPKYDEEVIRLVKSMPKWNGVKGVSVGFTLPVTFKIEDEETTKKEEKN